MALQLTAYACRDLMQAPIGDQKEMVVQALNIKFNDDTKKCFVVLSDGYAHKTGIVSVDKYDLFKASGIGRLDIIKVLAFRYQTNNGFGIVEFEKLMSGVPQIGKPLAYEEFAKLGHSNPEGSHLIPMSQGNESYSSTTGHSNRYAPSNASTYWNSSVSNQNSNPNMGNPFLPNPVSRPGFGGSGAISTLPVQESRAMSEVQPIALMTMYNENWTIRGRVIQKSDIRTWNNDRGSGKFFKIVILDDSGKIQASFFNSTVDKFFAMIEEGGIYLFSDGKLKPNYGKFNNTRHEYEISFEDNSTIVRLSDDGSIGTGLSLKTIEQIRKTMAGESVDVAGIIVNEGMSEQIPLKSGERKAKRSIQIIDESMDPIEVTLWGSAADAHPFSKNNIIIFRGLKVTSFQNTMNLSFVGESQVITEIIRDPRIEQLLSFKSSQDFHERASAIPTSTGDPASAARFYTNLDEMERMTEEMPPGPDEKMFFTVLAYVAKVFGDYLLYPSCPGDKCMKKMILNGMEWQCPGCNQVVKEPCYRYIGSVSLVDSYRQVRCKFNNNSGKAFFGCEGNILQNLKERDEPMFQEEIQKNCSKLKRFQILAKKEIYNGIVRNNYSIFNVFDEPARENKTLLSMMEAYENLA